LSSGGALLREVSEADLPRLFEHQRDPAATRMAAFAPRHRAAFFEHWQRILAAPEVFARTVACGGEVAGHVVCFERGGRREVGYWIARAFWGRGLATRALGELLAEVAERPLYGIVAEHNAPSRRVLEKHGFRLVAREAGPPGAAGEEIVDLVLRLDA
jgi:RimJ/RimL family protein N-acetyltransferase